MTEKRKLEGMSAEEAVEYVMNNDISHLFADAEVVRNKRPPKMVTALRIDLDIQVELEHAAEARGIGSSTLMREIIEDWVRARRAAPKEDRLQEVVRHLDAARRLISTLGNLDPPPTASGASPTDDPSSRPTGLPEAA